MNCNSCPIPRIKGKHILFVAIVLLVFSSGFLVLKVEHWRGIASTLEWQKRQVEGKVAELEKENNLLKSEICRILKADFRQPKAYIDSTPQLRLVLPFVPAITMIELYNYDNGAYLVFQANNYRGYIEQPEGLPIGNRVFPVLAGHLIMVTVRSSFGTFSWTIAVEASETK